MAEVLGDAAQVGTARSGGQLDISTEVRSGRPLLGDEFEIRSVATNLAINAVAFTPPGGKVVLRWETSRSGGRISATDTGIGIRREHLPRLTERFYRVRGEGSPVVPGTGPGAGHSQARADPPRGSSRNRKQARFRQHLHLPLPPQARWRIPLTPPLGPMV